MGCWNKTCGMSGLPIHSGTEVYVFPLVENKNYEDRCYTTPFWKPHLIPWVAKYDDYGCGEEDSGEALGYFLDKLKKTSFKPLPGVELTEQRSIKWFYESVRNSVLFEYSYAYTKHDAITVGDYRQHDFVMVRKDFADEFIDKQVDKFWSTKSGGYEYISYKDVLSNVDSEFENIVRGYNAVENDSFKKLSFFIDHEHDQEPSFYFLTHINYRYACQFKTVMIELMHMVEDGKKQEASEIYRQFVIGGMIENIFSMLRKVWIPASHEGSQADDLEPYNTHIEVMNSTIEKIKKQWDDFE